MIRSFITRALWALTAACVTAAPVSAQTAQDALTAAQQAQGLAVQAAGVQTPPSAFAWNFAAHPLKIYRAPNGRYSTDLDPRAATPTIRAIFDGVAAGTTGVVYADAAAANNTANGTTNATPKQGIRSALAVCEANSAYTTGCIAYVKAGLYDRTRDFNNSSGFQSGGTQIAKNTAIICYGGPCIVTPAPLGLTWTVNGTYSTVYQATRSAVINAINRTANDSYGDPNQFVNSASLAAVAACVATDCRYNDGTIEYVKRADGAVPSDANMLLLFSANAIRLPDTGDLSFFMSGFTVYGGSSGAFQSNPSVVSSRDIVIEDSTLMFPAAGNAFTLDNDIGFVGLWRTVAGKAPSDSYNPHASAGGSYDLLFVDSVARDTGRSPGQSNNCITAHDGAALARAVRIIVLNGTCLNPHGGAFRDIGYSDAWIMNYAIDGDIGDIVFGGTLPSTCFETDDFARMWIQDSRCIRTLIGLNVGSNASISIRRFDDGGGIRQGAGTVTKF